MRRLGWWFAHQPRAIQIGLAVVVLAALAAGTYYGQTYVQKRKTAREVAAAWGEYNTAARKSNLEGLQEALHRVLAANPADPTATRYKAMLDRGEADPDAHDLAVVLLHHHLKNQRLPEAAREAEKVLAHNPKDWQARCAVADYALNVRKDRALAEHHLAQLPDPEDPAANTFAVGLHYAIQLSNSLSRDATSLRRLIVRRLVPGMRSASATTAPAATKCMLIECYLAGFADPSSWSELAESWAAADRLADSAVTEAIAAGEVPLLMRLAQLGPRMRAALAVLRENDPARLPDDRFQPLVKAVDERTRRAWLVVREKSPEQVEAYVGLANLAFLENNPNGALAQVMDGLAACGNRIELLELQLRLVALFGDNDNLVKLANSYRRAALDAKTDPMKWCLVANIWMILDRRDYALEACDQALAIQRDHPLACQIAALILVQSGKPIQIIQARDLLSRLGETALRTNPALASLNARVLIESGLGVLIEDEFNKVMETQSRLKPKTSAPAVGFLLGVFNAPPDRERAEWVAARSARVAAGDSQAPAARLLRFEALYRLAELSVTADPRGGLPLWDSGRLAAVLQGFEELTLAERAEPAVAAMLAAIQLKGQGNAAAALRTISALHAMEGSLGAAQLEVLGAVLIATDRTADGQRVLERAEKLPRPTAGLRVALALAYHKNKQPGDRDAAIQRAENTPTRSPREQAELIAAKLLFQRENP